MVVGEGAVHADDPINAHNFCTALSETYVLSCQWFGREIDRELKGGKVKDIFNTENKSALFL